MSSLCVRVCVSVCYSSQTQNFTLFQAVSVVEYSCFHAVTVTSHVFSTKSTYCDNVLILFPFSVLVRSSGSGFIEYNILMLC